jgi:HSP20 family protein
MTKLMIRPTRNSLTHEFDRFFDGFFNSPIRMVEEGIDFQPRVNIKESDDDVRLTFEVPGMDKDAIKITVADNVLTVSGSREFKEESKEGGYVRSEIRSGSFSRSFTLPDTVDTGKIQADYKDGMLDIRIAKLEEVKPKEIEIKVG